MASDAIRSVFSDRRDAGRRLAERLVPLRRENPIVVSLPNGALYVADEVADRLQAPLRLMVAHRLGAPGTTSTIMGTLWEGGALALGTLGPRAPGPSDEQVALESVELYRRSSVLRRWSPPVAVVRRTAILVDDGSVRAPVLQAAVAALRAERPGRIVFATPLLNVEVAETVRRSVHEVVPLQSPAPPLVASDHYESFEAVGDDVVQEILRDRGT